MIRVNIEHSENLDIEDLTDLENLPNFANLTDLENLADFENLFALSGDKVDKNSEEYLNNFVSRVELVKLDDLTIPNCKAILKNTFERYANFPLLEIERHAFYPTSSNPDWLLMRRSPFMFEDVLVTTTKDYALVFQSDTSSAFKNIPRSSHFGVINEGSYFVSKRELKGMTLHSELFYVPLIAENYPY